MLSTLKEYIIAMGELIRSAFDFVLGFFEDIVYIIKLTGSFVAKLPQFFSFLPAPVITLLISIFAVVVIYKVLGREG